MGFRAGDSAANTLSLTIAANQRVLFPESRQLANERAGSVTSGGDDAGAGANAAAHIDGGASSLPLVVSLELDDGSPVWATDNSDATGELDYRARKPLQRLGEADPAFLTKRVRVAVERDRIVVKMVYYYVHEGHNAADGTAPFGAAGVGAGAVPL